MKKFYTAPEIEVETYTLNQAIASNCAMVVTNGPAMGEHPQCDDYVPIPEPDPDEFAVSTFSMRAHNVNFYDKYTCSCYYSSSDRGYWTS